MPKRAFLLLAVGLSWSAVAAGQTQPAQPPLASALAAAQPARTHACSSSDPAEVVVCGRSGSKYRIDPVVLAANRAAEAPPPKPELDATHAAGCVGPNCGGGTIPLVGMALTALKAAELAGNGDDWRDAFRTRPDAYSTYEAAKEKRSGRPSVSLGIVAAGK